MSGGAGNGNGQSWRFLLTRLGDFLIILEILLCTKLDLLANKEGRQIVKEAKWRLCRF
jgi:hypothetical protein